MGIRIADTPEADRPRERLWNTGPAALADRELVALLLRNGIRGLGALSLADALLMEFGSLRALAAAETEEISSNPGIGPVKAATLVAAFELGRRVRSEPDLRIRPITKPRDLVSVVGP